jgi:hypothetical protein
VLCVGGCACVRAAAAAALLVAVLAVRWPCWQVFGRLPCSVSSGLGA